MNKKYKSCMFCQVHDQLLEQFLCDYNHKYILFRHMEISKMRRKKNQFLLLLLKILVNMYCCVCASKCTRSGHYCKQKNYFLNSLNK